MDTEFVTFKQFQSFLSRLERENIKRQGETVAAVSMRLSGYTLDIQDDREGMLMKVGWREAYRQKYLLPHVIKGKKAATIAQRKARYGHRDWVAWKGKDGEIYAARATSQTFKMAMLATGTQGIFTCYEGSTGRSHLIRWPVAVTWLANLKFAESGNWK